VTERVKSDASRQEAAEHYEYPTRAVGREAPYRGRPKPICAMNARFPPAAPRVYRLQSHAREAGYYSGTQATHEIHWNPLCSSRTISIDETFGSGPYHVIQ
jgi:hypothetical protein